MTRDEFLRLVERVAIAEHELRVVRDALGTLREPRGPESPAMQQLHHATAAVGAARSELWLWHSPTSPSRWTA